MAGWLQKIITPPPVSAKPGALPARRGSVQRQTPQTLPNATIIYGIGASLLFVAAGSLLLHGRWFAGVIVFALGICLTGFALHLLKHGD